MRVNQSEAFGVIISLRSKQKVVFDIIRYLAFAINLMQTYSEKFTSPLFIRQVETPMPKVNPSHPSPLSIKTFSLILAPYPLRHLNLDNCFLEVKLSPMINTVMIFVTDMIFVKFFTLLDFQVTNFTP